MAQEPPTESVVSGEPPQPAEAPPPPSVVPAPQIDVSAPAAQPPAVPPSQPLAPWQTPPEVPGPAPGLAFGGAGERLVAYIVDYLIIFGISILCLLLFFLIIPIFVAVLVWFVYFPYFWKTRGQTPGLRMFNLYVVRDDDGGSISWGQAILRFIGYWIDGLVFYLGFIWIFIDSRKRCWHDLIAGTVVVKRI